MSARDKVAAGFGAAALTALLLGWGVVAAVLAACAFLTIAGLT